MEKTTKPRPSMFIGSSSEGLGIAEAIQLNLDRACEVTVWSQGIFGLGTGATLQSLAARLDDFDFAVLVLTADDVTISRGETKHSPRDNVLLELGMGIGALGQDRTFIVCDRDVELKLPSDLAGVTPATYQIHADGNLQSSLGAATTLLKGAIQKLGKRSAKIVTTLSENTHFQIVHDLLDGAPQQFFILMYETDSAITRDSFFASGIKFEYHMKNGSAGQGQFSMDRLCSKLPDAGILQAI
ncbi:MAG TPA: TIR domain-containing protein [Pirellulales bacterium]|nr:TIR domain-containing protein [Pirellulales bacterium]